MGWAILLSPFVALVGTAATSTTVWLDQGGDWSARNIPFWPGGLAIMSNVALIAFLFALVVIFVAVPVVTWALDQIGEAP